MKNFIFFLQSLEIIFYAIIFIFIEKERKREKTIFSIIRYIHEKLFYLKLSFEIIFHAIISAFIEEKREREN